MQILNPYSGDLTTTGILLLVSAFLVLFTGVGFFASSKTTIGTILIWAAVIIFAILIIGVLA